MSDQAPAKERHPWLWGCGIGCGAVLLIGVLAIIAVTFYARRGMEHVKVLAVEQLSESYEQYQNAGKLTPQQEEVFAPLTESCREKEVSFFVPMIVLALFQENIKTDGTHSAESLTVARDFRDFLQSNPRAGMGDVFAFMSKYPWLSEAFSGASKNTPPFLLRPNK